MDREKRVPSPSPGPPKKKGRVTTSPPSKTRVHAEPVIRVRRVPTEGPPPTNSQSASQKGSADPVSAQEKFSKRCYEAAAMFRTQAIQLEHQAKISWDQATYFDRLAKGDSQE